MFSILNYPFLTQNFYHMLYKNISNDFIKHPAKTFFFKILIQKNTTYNTE